MAHYLLDVSNMTFVFGSNEAGIHGKGAAAFAEKFKGARYRQGVGKVGQSYAIPTKDRRIISLPLERIKEYVEEFIDYANRHQEEKFQITQIGCGLALFEPEEIAPLFSMAPCNCYFDTAWDGLLGPNKQYWGHV